MSDHSNLDGSSETSPLLINRPVSPQSSDTTEQKPAARLSNRSFCYLALFLLIELYSFIIGAPLTVLFEKNICDVYYSKELFIPSNTVRNCKIEPIQQELAHLKGWKGFFDTLPVFVVAFSLGKASDRLGRGRALAMSLTGTLVGYLWILAICYIPAAIPIKMIWSSAAFYLFGGGFGQVNATIILMNLEAAGEAYRSRIIYYLYSLYLFAELIGPAIASLAIATSLWLAFSLGLAILLIGLAATLFIPDTHKNTESSSLTTPPTSSPADRHSQRVGGTVVLEDDANFLGTCKALLRYPNMLAALPILVIGQFRSATLNLLLQYVTVKFGWTFSEAALLTSEIAAVNLFLLGPFLSFALPRLQSRYGWNTSVIDLWVLRVSLCALSLGALVTGLAPGSGILILGVLVLSFGLGCRASLLALLTPWIAEPQRGRFFGIVQIVENFGVLVADPIAQNVFAASLSLSRAWLGLPFWIMAMIYFTGAVLALFIRVS